MASWISSWFVVALTGERILNILVDVLMSLETSSSASTELKVV